MTYQKAVTSTQYYDEIAKEINLLNKETKLYFPSELTDGVRMVSENRYAEGYRDGEEQGRQAQFDEFWDSMLPEGEVLDLQYAFGGKRWDTNTFNPPRAIVGSSFFRCFAETALTAITQTIDATQATGSTALQNMFNNAKNFEKIGDFCVSEKTTFHNTTFNGCTSLKTLNLRGTVGKNGLSLHDCTKLTASSLLTILKACNKENSNVIITLPANKESVINDNSELLEELTRATNETYKYKIAYS